MKQLDRRGFIAGGLVGGAAIAGITIATHKSSSTSVPLVELGAQPAGLPAAQHAWQATLHTDRYGNPFAPSYDRLLLFDVVGQPTPGDARRARGVAAHARTVVPLGPRRPALHRRLGARLLRRLIGADSPVPVARALSDFELPTIDDYQLCLHLACDDERPLPRWRRRLFMDTNSPRPVLICRSPSILQWQRDPHGLHRYGPSRSPPGCGRHPARQPGPNDGTPVHGLQVESAANQATEDDITIAHGPFAGGTTMHVSYMRLRLDSWYQDLDQDGRVARMYAPEVTPGQAARFTTDAASDPQLLSQAIRRHGVIGHAQTSARARRNGRPIILTRLRHSRRRASGPPLRRSTAHHRGLRDHTYGHERRLGAAREPRDQRHRQQRDQRVHLRPQTSQLHPALPGGSVVPSASRPQLCLTSLRPYFFSDITARSRPSWPDLAVGRCAAVPVVHVRQRVHPDAHGDGALPSRTGWRARCSGELTRCRAIRCSTTRWPR